MSNQEQQTKPDGGASVSTDGLGSGYAVPIGHTMTLTQATSSTWAEMSAGGVLTKFDNAECRRLAAEFNPNVWLDQNQAIARLCISLLERAAQEVDHILREGGGTQGDTIRALMIPNAEVS